MKNKKFNPNNLESIFSAGRIFTPLVFNSMVTKILEEMGCLNPEIERHVLTKGKYTPPTCMKCGYLLKKEEDRCSVCGAVRVWIEPLPSIPEDYAAYKKRMSQLNHYESSCLECKDHQYFHLSGDLKLLRSLESLSCPRCGTTLNPTLKKLAKHTYFFYCPWDHEEFDIHLDDDIEVVKKNRPKCRYCGELLRLEGQRW